MVGQLPPEIEFLIENKINATELPAYMPTKSWAKARKYEENTLVVDLRELDPNGTLEQVTELDKSTGRFIPKVEVISGCLIIRLRREL